MMSPDISTFESRKRDHLNLALDDRHEAMGLTSFDQIRLDHDAWPSFDFEAVSIESTIFGRPIRTPFYVSGMTAGHADANALNQVFAEACRIQGWAFGVGSQRRQLTGHQDIDQWAKLRQANPDLVMFSNIGITQIAENQIDSLLSLVYSLQSQALVVHFNPLQECVQAEGTPYFQGSVEALIALAKELDRKKIPLILKETGSGFSKKTLQKFAKHLGKNVAAVDVSGLGGTHWGRIEGTRSGGLAQKVSETFSDWGISTVESIQASVQVSKTFETGWETWASGGVRTGLDAAKAIYLGAHRAGFAKPALQAALAGPQGLIQWMQRIEKELKTALFCTGNQNIKELAKQRND